MLYDNNRALAQVCNMFESLAVIGFIGLWILNFILSIINAVSVGLAWHEANILGGFRKLANWSAWVMSACGFTWCYLILAMILASYYDFLDAKTIGLIGDMGYLLIIFPIIGTGIAITIDSWAYAWKTKSFTGFGVSSYNTVATGFNIFTAIEKVPEVFWNVIGAIFDRDSGDNDNGKGAMALIIVIFVAVAGFLTTHLIVKWVSRKHSKRAFQKIKEAYSYMLVYLFL